jgi:serine/threonine protein kinase/Tfp pilus assembly protein PilF
MDVVGAAMQCPAGERDECLVSACREDPDLLAEARELLAQATTTSFSDVTSRMMGALERAAADAADDVERLPAWLGPYRIVRVLGRGGMGVVYLGRQEQPLRRDVAIKVIRAGGVDREARARFAAERQALARMEHPAIARVHDARTTDDGVPYFVMELVEGLPITEYCDRERLGLDARLELFRTVCGGVHHAHQRGVIHRDLKPSNVLVNTVDGGATPKVIDFGVAKAIDGMLADESLHTSAGSLIGTLDYMSPEQVRGLDGDVDVRSDIYALGVILYELVCGRHPLAEATLGKVGLIEAQRIITQTEPPRPSSSLTSPSGAAERAQRRATDEVTLRRRLREDLDWIVMKALEKDRGRRYQSALELAQDLERYADHKPVTAKPPTLSYRIRKFVRRHRAGVAAAAVIVLALISGAGMAGAGFVRATAEARRAEAISGFLSDLLASVRPDQDGRAVTVQEVLEGARQQILAGGLADDPETQASLALVIGHSYEGLGRFAEAIELLELSAELRRRQHRPDDERLRASLFRLGTVLWKQGALEEALTIRLALAEMTERTLGTSHPDHAESLSNLGNTYADLGRLELAVENLRNAVEVGRSLDGREGELNLARFLSNLGTVYSDQRDYESATSVFREALEIRERLLGEESGVHAITSTNLGNALTHLGELDEAERVLSRAVALEERIFGDDQPTTAFAYNALAEVHLRQGRPRDSEPLTRRALLIRIATAGDTYWRIAIERRKLAEAYIATDRLREAETELLTAWEGLTAAGETSHPRALHVAETMARVQSLLGDDADYRMWTERAAGS